MRWAIILSALFTSSVFADTLILNPSKDNSLYESETGHLSNGQGQYLFVGKTSSGSIRRAVLAFPVTEKLPKGATIDAVRLRLHLSKTIAAPSALSLHRLEQDWGEGSSKAGGQEGGGADAKIGDSTWIHSQFSNTLWQQAGGDFVTRASASQTPDTPNNSYTWGSTPELLADVQQWIAQPETNFGWIIIGDESQNLTAKRFNSREFADSALQPQLEIEYHGGEPIVNPITDPFPEPIATGDLHFSLKPLADNMVAPNFGTFAPGDNAHLYVSDQPGILWRINLDSGEKIAFADFSSDLITLNNSYDERGFLGFAFHPNYADNGLLYTYTSDPAQASADFALDKADHDSVIKVWQLEPQNPDAHPAQAQELLRIAQPARNHNGGGMVFDAQGLLYIALGDGGGADDAYGNGQNLQTPLGSILRIDPLGSNSNNGRYGIPSDNPFINQTDVVPEIFAYGLRNPFRLSIDKVSGDIYAADVGQHQIEEVNKITAGGNYGWPLKEGSFAFDANGSGRGFVTDAQLDDQSLIDPVAAYDHDEGISIIGGFVQNLAQPSPANGYYLFADYAKNFKNGGRLFAWRAGEAIQSLSFLDREHLGLLVLGFAEDAQGNLYVLGNDTGNTTDKSGVVWRLVPESHLDLDRQKLHMHYLEIGNQAYQLDLALVNTQPIRFQVLLDSLIQLPSSYVATTSDASFNPETQILQLPSLSVKVDAGIERYRVVLRLEGADLQLQLLEAALLP